jgi:Flp pilus assembly protein TadD
MKNILLSCAMLALTGCGTLPDFSATHAPAPTPVKELTLDGQASLYLAAIDGLVKQQRYGAALAFLDRYAVGEKDPEPRYWLLRGDALLGCARIGEALAAYGKLSDTPLAAQGWNGQGRALAGARDWRGAEGYFKRAVSSEPANADFLNNLAYARLHLGARGEAVADLRQARELDPRSALVRDNLFIALTLQGDSTGAQAILADIADNAKREKIRTTLEALLPGFTPEGKS